MPDFIINLASFFFSSVYPFVGDKNILLFQLVISVSRHRPLVNTLGNNSFEVSTSARAYAHTSYEKTIWLFII